MSDAWPRARRRSWIAVAGWTAVILVATLSPGPETTGNGSQWPWWPFDLVQNLALFAPLGASGFLATRSRSGTLAAGAALSAAVELLQMHAIRGRDASLGDWIANTLGTAAGIGLGIVAEAWLRRRAR